MSRVEYASGKRSAVCLQTAYAATRLVLQLNIVADC